MAANSIHSLHHGHHPLRRRHSIDFPPSPYFLRLPNSSATANPPPPPPTLSRSFSSIAFSVPSSSPVSTSQSLSFDLLRHHLSSRNFRQADEETRRLLISLAGEAAQKRGYVFFSEVQFISEDDLRTIDELWRQNSDGKFGYGVQRKVWGKVGRDFTKFFLKVGWMKKLETEVEQYNYRAFPEEFTWELDDKTPEGHLPLTNALRGTQLLGNILSHPAFQGDDDDDDDDDDFSHDYDDGDGGQRKIFEEKSGELKGSKSKTLSNRLSKPDYSF